MIASYKDSGVRFGGDNEACADDQDPTRSFIFNDLSDVSFAVQDTNNVDGVFFESVINPNGFKSDDRP